MPELKSDQRQRVLRQFQRRWPMAAFADWRTASLARQDAKAALARLESGGNALHGRLFEYLSHYKLNANNFFSNRANQKLNPSRNNNFGGMLSGPVYIPKVYDGRNRTFFLFDHEWTLATSQTTVLQSVPTVLEKSGNFSQTFNAAAVRMPIFDPFTTYPNPSGTGYLRDPFPGNVVLGERYRRLAISGLDKPLDI